MIDPTPQTLLRGGFAGKEVIRLPIDTVPTMHTETWSAGPAHNMGGEDGS